MTKKTSLTAALSDKPVEPKTKNQSLPVDRSGASAPPRPDRAGKTNITGYFDMP